MGTTLQFLGGAGTVTGSKYLVTSGRTRVLVDCGLFQGFKHLRLRNWAPLPVAPSSIDAVVLTHAHIDHSGYLPRLVADGFQGPVYSTDATRDLCGILLPDSAHLQEKDAEFANRQGFSKHHPALPLYTRADAEAALARLVPVAFDTERRIASSITIRFQPAGHILGAAIVSMICGKQQVVFSGDLGRTGSATMVDPAPVQSTDYLLVESTYGNRRHDQSDPEDALAAAISRTAARGGTVIIPSFAVGRAQSLLYHIHRLKVARRIPDLPVFLDSPMSIDASELFCRHHREHKLNAEQARAACSVARYVRDPEESKALDANPMPKIIVSASGMATGGRILHHLKHYAPDPRNLIMFAGFQAGGTRGAAMTEGAESIKIHGQYFEVRVEVRNLSMFSAHADGDEVMEWLRTMEEPPKQTFVVHGEPTAADTLRHRIEEELGWDCRVPEHLETVPLP